jgi:serine protease AprX
LILLLVAVLVLAPVSVKELSPPGPDRTEHEATLPVSKDLALSPGGSGVLEPVLEDRAYLEENEYILQGDRISIIIELRDTAALPVAKALVLAALDARGDDFEHRHDLAIINAFSGTVPYGSLAFIASLDPVEKVWLNRRGSLDLQDSVPLIEADQVWQHDDHEGLPIKGDGIVVSIIDSGIKYDHQEFGSCSRPIEYSNCSKIVGGYDYVDGDNDPYDKDGHGTHVAGIAGANGVELNGTAPNVKFLIYRVSDDGQIDVGDAIAAVNKSVIDGADVISMSLRFFCNPCDGSTPISQAIDNAANNHNITSAVSMGNQGPDNQDDDTPENNMQSPADSREAITVGATYKKTYEKLNGTGHSCNNEEQSVLVDQIACFSSRGPTDDGRTKPDIVAPGSRINSTEGLSYSRSSGTSMSTPHVSGVVALMKQAYPDWDPQKIKSKLKNSTIIYTGNESPDENGRDPDNTYGWGRVNAHTALVVDQALQDQDGYGSLGDLCAAGASLIFE